MIKVFEKPQRTPGRKKQQITVDMLTAFWSRVPDRASSLIRKNMSVVGDLSCKEDLIVNGMVRGRIDIPRHCLIIGGKATLQADISAESVFVNGSVTGNIHASDKVEIGSTASVLGDITAETIQVADGAFLKGVVRLTGKKKKSAAKKQSEGK
jgi:cytoskeletal protein CcmA (bactofilin family)